MSIKKLLCLALAVIMVAAIGVGCTGTPAASNPPNASAPSAPAEASTDEHMEISIALWDFMTAEDELSDIINEKLNITIVPRGLSWDNDAEQRQLFAATNDMPDLVASYTAQDPARFYSWVDQGVIRSIPYEMIAKYDNVKKIVDGSNVLEAVKTIKGGEYWFIPRPGSQSGIYVAQQHGIYYRKDWMENVGITKVPETLQDYYELLKAYKDGDPDGNGKADTIGMSLPRFSANSVSAILSVGGVNPEQWVQEDGQWVPGYYSDRMIEPLKFMHKIYQEGILDPEFTAANWRQAVTVAANNISGSFVRNADIYQQYNQLYSIYRGANEGVDNPFDIWDIMPPLKLNANEGPYWPLLVDGGGTEISANVDDAKLERILMLFEFLLSDEGFRLRVFGVEGITYEMKDGKVVQIMDPATGEAYVGRFPSQAIGNLTDWNFDYDASDEYIGTIPAYFRDSGKRTRDMYNPAAIKENILPKLIATPAKDNLTITFGDAYTAIIQDKRDVDTTFAEFKADCLAKGLQAAIDEVTAEMTKLGQ